MSLPTQIGGGTEFGIPTIYGNPMAGYGYYIENKLQELDSPGEWFYDTQSSTLTFEERGGARRFRRNHAKSSP